MTLTMFRAKLHRLRVTEADLFYEGSITIDTELVDAAGLRLYERVQIVNNNNGERFETYIIPGEPGSRVVCLNGAAARKVQKGDEIIVMAYAQVTPEEAAEMRPRVVIVDENNDPKDIFNMPAQTGAATEVHAWV